jgi:hypothetical protein
MTGQISLFDIDAHISFGGCRDCICKDCLLYHSGRCPYGGCYDDWRNKHKPYDKNHPDKPPRTLWSNWKTDQGYWCRGGTFYPAIICPDFTAYKGSRVEECLEAVVQVFQDGYIECSLLESLGCTECFRRFEKRMEGE